MTVFNGLNIWLRLPATAIIAILFFSAPILIHAQDSEPAPDEASQLAAIDFVVGNAVFILLHEFGHVVIRDFDIPLLGLEENAADTLAAVGLILADENHSERQPRLSEYLAMAALGNLLIWQTGIEKSSNEILFWAQHDVSVRRATRLVCLLYGSDTREFGWLAEAVEMPESRRDVCEDEFAIARNATEKVLATFGKSAEGQAALDRTEIEVKYGRPRNPTQARLLEVIQKTQLMETFAERIRNRWILPDSVTLRVRSCPSANAYWDEDYRELIFCLELLEGLEKIGSGPEVQRLKANFAKARD